MDDVDLAMLRVYRDAGKAMRAADVIAATSISLTMYANHLKFLRRHGFVSPVREPIYGNRWFRITDAGTAALAQELLVHE